MSVLLLVGIGLVVFGAVVLLWFPTRPGGRIRWHGMEVSSAGAGLPLIVVGVVAVAISGGELLRDGGDGGGAGGGGEAGQTAPAACLDDYFEGIPPERRATLAAGVHDRDVVRASEPKGGLLGLAFTDARAAVGAARIDYDPENMLFQVESVVDGSCEPVETFENSSRPGSDPRALQNFDTLRMRLAGRAYDLHLGAASTIRVSFVRFEP